MWSGVLAITSLTLTESAQMDCFLDPQDSGISVSLFGFLDVINTFVPVCELGVARSAPVSATNCSVSGPSWLSMSPEVLPLPRSGEWTRTADPEERGLPATGVRRCETRSKTCRGFGCAHSPMGAPPIELSTHLGVDAGCG